MPSPNVPRVVLEVPGHPDLAVCVYGKVHASTLSERQEQSYFVSLNDKPVARAELLDAEKTAVREIIGSKCPEHACI